MTDKQSLEDRMRGYESRDKVQYPNTSVIVARIDGRGFSKLTKNMTKPFDARFTDAMVHTTRALVEETCATVGYTQSDEISLVWHCDNPEGQVFFNGKVQKLVSICASIATAYFNEYFYPGELAKLAQFDCRVFEVPSKGEAINYLIYRQRDGIRNSVSMVAQHKFSHRSLMGVSTNEQLEMLRSRGIDWANDFKPANQIGTFMQRRPYMRDLGDGTSVRRTSVEALDITDVKTYEALYDMVFGKKEDAESLKQDEIECIIGASALYSEILEAKKPSKFTEQARAILIETGRPFDNKDLSAVLKGLKENV